MRRTYRSKKDTTGTLDHRDVLHNLDEKSSAFDAFYIQHIKQTKRELSCVGSSNPLGIASNKVRNRKYVKRIVKEAKIFKQKESASPVAFLTPDKSFRVNKPLDPFDLLLNSSPACQVVKTPVHVETIKTSQPKKAGKRYTRKKVKNLKQIRYSSSDSSDLDKENSSSQYNITDIRSHKLLVEREPSHNPKLSDKSIDKIVNNLSLFSKIKQKSNNTFNTSFKHIKMRLSRNNSPILQKSPLCSTPFKEKYRGESIYAFSPISIKRQSGSPNYVAMTEENNDSNNSILYVTTNRVPKLSNCYESTSSEAVSNVDEIITTNKAKDTELQKSDDVFVDEMDVVVPENVPLESFHEYIKNKTNPSLVKEKSLNITEVTPFLGFSEVDKEDVGKNIPNKTDTVSNIELTLQTTEAEELFLGFSKVNESLIKDREYLLEHLEEVNVMENNDSKSINIDCNKNDKTTQTVEECESYYNPDGSINSSHDVSEKESMYDTCSDMSSNENIQNKAIKEPVVYIERIDHNTLMKYCSDMSSNENSQKEATKELVVHIERMNHDILMKYNGKRYFNSNDSTDSSFVNENDNKPDFSNTDARSVEESDDDYNSNKHDNTKNKSYQDNCVESENDKISDSQNLSYSINNDDTIKYKMNNMSNISNDIQSNVSENDNLFIISDAYFVRNVNEDDDFNSSRDINMSNISSNDSSNVTHDENTSFNSITTDSNELEPINGKTITDSDDITSNEEDASEEEHISFVTTRRRNDFTKDSMFQFDNDDNYFVSSSTDCDKTVLSNKVNLTRPSIDHSEIQEEYNIATAPNKFDVEIANNNNEQLVTVRKSRLTRQSNVDFFENYDATLTEKDTGATDTECDIQEKNDRISFVNTRKTRTNSFRESNIISMDTSRVEVRPSIVLHPGKKWERSLSIYKRISMMTDHFDQSFLEDENLQSKGRNYRQSVISTMGMQDSLHNESIISRKSTFVSKPSRSTIRFVKDTDGNDSRASLNNTTIYDDLGFLNEECDDTVIELSKLSLADSHHEVSVIEPFHELERVTTAKDYVLRRCNQTEPLLFDECYPETVLKNCHKIGEGVYGEVFLWRARDGRARVMKIVPIAGDVKVNGEQQKDFHEIISEIVIAMELSALRAPIAAIDRHFEDGGLIDEIDLHAVENATDVFNEVLAVRCTYGPYPSRLLDLWELYDECKGSENDNPAALPVDQQYIVLELANAGQDLESFQFTGAQQAHALFQQIAFGLAVGEEACQFEHRDLHWGNVLIAPTEQKYATFVIRGRVVRVPRAGVCATIIDYSLSRVSLALAPPAPHPHPRPHPHPHPPTAALYNDLAADDALFDAVGDYQFEVYRLMRDKLGNEWKNFEPYTNILWLHYTVDKMITALRYKRTNTKIHKHYIDKLKGIKDRILTYTGATDYVLTDNEI